MSAKPKNLPSDHKAQALAAFLFFADREFNVSLCQPNLAMYWELQVVREDTIELPRCPLLDDPTITCEEARVPYSDIVTTWTIPMI